MDDLPVPNPTPQRPPTGQSVHPGLIVVLMALVGFLIFSMLDDRGYFVDPAASRVVTPRGDLAADEQVTVELFEKIRTSVVFIETRGIQMTYDRELREYIQQHEVPLGAGTGFIWDADGHILTNLHVVREASSAVVQLADKSVWNARQVGIYPEHDLAVLKIDAPPGKLAPIPLGTSSDLKVGQTVFALGYPFGLSLTFTKGIISGLGQTIPLANGSRIPDAIQTDAAINPGNSGGPLLDSAGRLIGMNTAIFSPTKTSIGVGFALPVDVIRDSVARLLETSPTIDRKLGIEYWPVLVELHNPNTGKTELAGIEILHVLDGGLAKAAELEGVSLGKDGRVYRGDLIIAVDGQPVESPAQFERTLQSLKSGDAIELRLLRRGLIGEITLTIP